jgi:PAS domain S-box-containing protein
MDSHSSSERWGSEGKLHGQSPATESQQPKPDAEAVLDALPDAVAEKEKMLHAIFHAITEPLLLLDREGRIVTCNEAAAKRLRRGAQELVGLVLSDCLAAVAPADVREHRMARIAEVLRSAAPVHFTDERSGLVCDNTFYPVLDRNGQVAGIVIFARDITECRRAEKELHEYHESMRDAERLVSLGMISATLAHELTQPLSVVRLAIQNASAELERLNCPDVVGQDLQAGLAACSRIGAIVTRFRDVARRPAKAKEIEVHIDQVAQKTFRLLERSAKWARAALSRWTDSS